VHRDRRAPLPQAIRRLTLRRLLLRRRRLAAASTAVTALTLRRTRKAFSRPVHQLDRADAGTNDVLQRGLGALIRHAAVAVGDRPDLHPPISEFGFASVFGLKIGSSRWTSAAGNPAPTSVANSRLVYRIVISS